jgi:hypothetical protein
LNDYWCGVHIVERLDGFIEECEWRVFIIIGVMYVIFEVSTCETFYVRSEISTRITSQYFFLLNCLFVAAPADSNFIKEN